MKKQRLSQKAYEQIKDMIINNRLKPGVTHSFSDFQR